MRKFMVVLAILCVAGCAQRKLFEEVHVTNQERAASAHVAVLSVAPWEDYKDALKPDFKLTSSEALARVIPTTRSLEEKFLDIFQAMLKVSTLQPPTLTTTTTDSTAADGAKSHKVEDKTTPGAPLPVEVPAFTETAGALPPKTSVLESTLGVDPMLQYKAALALYQEVQILNRFIDDAVSKKDYVPYVVRLQVSIMPNLRKLPYDVYSNLSFFSGETEGTFDDGVPEVIPILVTDDLEATLHSRSVQNIRQLAFAASAMLKAVNLGGDIQKKTDSLQSVIGRDLNSLFTIAKVSSNTLRVRFGALQQSEASYAMIPQTHNVSVLLLVPLKADKKTPVDGVRVSAHTRIREVHTGDFLDSRREPSRLIVDSQIRDRHKDLRGLEGDKLEELRQAAIAGDVTKYRDLARLNDGNKNYHVDQLWEDLVFSVLGNNYSITSFKLPTKFPLQLPPPAQRLTVFDDGNAASVTLLGGKSLNKGALSATLAFNGNTIPYSKVEVFEKGHACAVIFPSLKPMAAAAPAPNVIALTLYEIGTAMPAAPNYAGVTYVPVDVARSFQMQSSATTVDVINNMGAIVLYFKPSPSTKVACRISGANIDSIVAHPNALLNNNRIEITGECLLKIVCKDIAETVSISAEATNGYSAPSITLRAHRSTSKEK